MKLIRVTVLLLIVTVCLLGFMLQRRTNILRGFEAVIQTHQVMCVLVLTVCCGGVMYLTFVPRDALLICMLIIAVAVYFIGQTENQLPEDALTILFGAMLGKGAKCLLRGDVKNALNIPNVGSGMRIVPLALVAILAFTSCWHLDVSENYYHGPRWMGLWDNPNEYGMLMAAGVVLAAGLIAASLKSTVQSPQSKEADSTPQPSSGLQPPSPTPASEGTFLRSSHSFAAIKPAIGNWQSAILLIAAGMIAVGLLFSYSRGAWVGTAIGLPYLAKAYGKFKWRWLLAAILVVASAVWFFWNTPQTAPWYFQRLDVSRGSVQHRMTAWKVGFEMMRDHPFGLGWNKTVQSYVQKYSPPEDGVAPITTNDYLMLGTQIGIPALLCFIVYVALQLGIGERIWKKAERGKRKAEIPSLVTCHLSPEASLSVACRAGALAMLVAFWFDGGLFKLATASVFWILLELGANAEGRMKNAEPDPSLVASAAAK